jgi:hypothetical protein
MNTSLLTKCENEAEKLRAELAKVERKVQSLLPSLRRSRCSRHPFESATFHPPL